MKREPPTYTMNDFANDASRLCALTWLGHCAFQAALMPDDFASPNLWIFHTSDAERNATWYGVA
jgi:hypothetical protein